MAGAEDLHCLNTSTAAWFWVLDSGVGPLFLGTACGDTDCVVLTRIDEMGVCKLVKKAKDSGQQASPLAGSTSAHKFLSLSLSFGLNSKPNSMNRVPTVGCKRFFVGERFLVLLHKVLGSRSLQL